VDENCENTLETIIKFVVKWVDDNVF
jgi:hypothetical protein